MKPGKWIACAVSVCALSSVAAAEEAKQEKENVQQVPQQETYPGRVTGQTPSSDPGGVRGTAPPGPAPGEPRDSVKVVPPGHRTPGASPGTVTATEPRGSFGEADQNRSGFIEQDEAGAVQGLDFQTADADKDGRLSLSEFEAATRRGSGDTAGDSASQPGSGTSGSSGMTR